MDYEFKHSFIDSFDDKSYSCGKSRNQVGLPYPFILEVRRNQLMIVSVNLLSICPLRW